MYARSTQKVSVCKYRHALFISVVCGELGRAAAHVMLARFVWTW